MKEIIISIVIVLSSSLYAFSQESQKIDKNLEDISEQYTECKAYFELVSKAFKVSGNEEAANSYLEFRDKAMSYSLLLASEGMSQDIAVQVTNSRIERYKKKMKAEIYNKYENISIIIDKYHFGCQKIVQNPPAKLMAILAKEMSEAENQTEGTYNLVVKGKSCVEGESQQLECVYQVGKDLNISIAGIGQPDTSVTFFKSDFDGDFYASYGLRHGCIIVKRGDKGITTDQLNALGSFTDYAFISPKNGKVFSNWEECQTAY